MLSRMVYLMGHQRGACGHKRAPEDHISRPQVF